jgi:cellobiose-specific phosphotransferase system component IIA
MLLIILALTGVAMTVFAQADPQAQTGDKELPKSYLYQWTDDKGVVHITDSLGKMPKQYRDKAIKLMEPKKEDVDQGQQARQKSVYPSGSASEAADAVVKGAWQRRMREAKQRLADAEKSYQELDQRRNELLRSWGGVASGHLAERTEAENIEREMKDAQREIGEAHNDIDVVIPDEARKEGIPPGWLRE